MNDGEKEGLDGALDLPTYDDGPHDDVEIELTEDDLGENLADFDLGEEEEEHGDEGEQEQAHVEEEPAAEAEEPEEGQEEKPRRRDAQKRIAELSRRAQEAERREQELQARLQQEAELRQKSDIAMMTHYERSLKTQAQQVKAKLQEAMSIGDTDQQIELQTELMQLQQDLSGVDNWRRQQEATRAAPVQQPEQTQQKPAQQQQQTTLEPTTADWVGRNTWFQPQSPEFDPEMHEEATLYARRIERRYRSEGRENEIGSVAYFTEIDRHMQSEFPDAFEPVSAPKKAAPPMSRNTTVTPVTRAAPEGQVNKNSKTIRLTSDQRRMAHQLAESGAIKKATGGRMTPAEAERYYAVHLMKQARR